jgi:hypothetical protein
MPTKTVRETPYTKRVASYDLTDDELDAITTAVDSLDRPVTTVRSEIGLNRGVGPAASGSVELFIPVLAEAKPFPEDLVDELETALLEEDIAGRIANTRVATDPAGEQLHPDDEHEQPLRGAIRIDARWNIKQTTER